MWKRNTFAYTVALAACVTVAGCGEDPGAGPSIAQLSGIYGLSDWLYVSGGDTLPITKDSYIEIEFLDEEHVRGEGIVWVRVPGRDSADTKESRVPLLGLLTQTGEIVPMSIEGWYYVRETGAADTLRFSLAAGAGRGSWIESFPWLLSENRNRFHFDFTGGEDRLRIVHSSR